MNNDKRHKSVQPVRYILYKKDNGVIMRNTMINHLGDSINLVKESILFNNQHTSPLNIHVTGGLAFLVILLGKEHSSPHWRIKCNSSSKYWILSSHSIGDDRIIEPLKVVS